MNDKMHGAAPFAGSTEMHRRINAYPWSSSAIASIDRWPQSLRATITTLLGSRYPMILLWGPGLIQIYNEAYIALIGAKHPDALGRSIKETQAESWEVIGPMIHQVMSTGTPIWVPAQMLPLERAGYREESYFSLSYSTVDDDEGRIAGMLCVCSEITQQIVAERRTRLLRDLALKAGEIRSTEATCRDIGAALQEHPLDVPFALLYLCERDGQVATLRAAVGIETGTAVTPISIRLSENPEPFWPLARAAGGETVLTDKVARHVSISGGPWGNAVCNAMVMPIASTTPGVSLGVLVAGVSPNRALDEGYSSFYDLLVSQVSVALRNARAYEDECKRAEALAELDRAKTAFFSNISHEFRTPLTLILGPVEDAIADPEQTLAGEQLRLVRRNALRLQKLVNTLLDFSRMEAGRAQARFVPTDLAGFTRDLASAFHSAANSAGLELSIDCQPLSAATYVDPAMWEKIVLNLLSNAVKYTHQGEIHIALRQENTHAVLTVRDSGVGIPEDELPRVFERFYRARATVGRSYEGTGIGLALVQELVKLHGGVIDVQSKLNSGSIFTVHLPSGFSHLPPDHIEHTPPSHLSVTGADAFTEEARHWSISDDIIDSPPSPTPPGTLLSDVDAELSTARILIVDDNADLRAYVARVLARRFRNVNTVADGATALDSARRNPPDIILSDVKMPGLDGFALVRELRADERTRAIPIILLSARAGEESTVDGLASGADDYLVKPFSARELLARVQTHLQMAGIRREMVHRRLVEQELRRAVNMRDEFLSVASHELRTPLTALALQADSLLRVLRAGTLRDETVPNLILKVITMRRQSNRLEALVQCLLDVSSIAADQLQLFPERVDIVPVLHAMVDELQEESEQSNTPLMLQGESAVVYVDRVRLEQILRALLANALKFGKGKPIDIWTVRVGDMVQIGVKDRGIGIAPSDQQRIFQRFERAVSGRHYGGLGLGLWIVGELLRAMHGNIRVESALGAGSTFLVELPTRNMTSTPKNNRRRGDGKGQR